MGDKNQWDKQQQGGNRGNQGGQQHGNNPQGGSNQGQPKRPDMGGKTTNQPPRNPNETRK